MIKTLFALCLLCSALIADPAQHAPGLLEIRLKGPERASAARRHWAQDRAATGLADLDRLIRTSGVRRIQIPAIDKRDTKARPVLVLEVDPKTDIEALARQYAQNPDVEYAGAVTLYRSLLSPDDPYFPLQWSHDDAHMDSEAAWDLETGDPSVPVAFIDTGLEWQHPDLEDNLWINSAEDANGNGRFDNTAFPVGDLDGIDNDGNGKIDDIIGWDFFGNDPDPSHTSGDHGTKVGGVVAAAAGNGQGVAGIAGGNGPGLKGSPIMVLRAGAGTSMYSTFIWQAIDYARLNGAKVINMSFAGSYNSTIALAVADAWDAGVLMTAGSGFQSTNTLKYPAAYPQVLAVSGTKQDDTKQNGSPWGLGIDVSAPGDQIWTTVPGGGYVQSPGGTPSLATAHVSGVAALIFSHLGPATPVDRVWATLKYSADHLSGATSTASDHWGFVGSGRINAFEALQMGQNTLVVPDQYPTVAAALAAAVPGQTVYLRPGVYSGNITMKAGVRLMGARSGLTSINGTVYLTNTPDAEITGLEIDGYIGLYISNSPGVVVRNCRISGNTLGVMVFGCTPILRHNRIEGNTYGIYLGSNAGTGIDAHNNLVADNSRGFYLRSTPTLYNRHNSVRGNTSFDLQATSGSGTIFAMRTWWGESPPDPAHFQTVNGIYYGTPLSADPIPGNIAAKATPRQPLPDPAPTAEVDQNIRDDYTTARQLLDTENIQDAATHYKRLLNNHPKSALARVALKELVGLYHHTGQSQEARQLLDNAAPALQRTAARLEFDLLLLEEQYGRAEVLGRQLARQWTGSDDAEDLELELARIERFEKKRPDRGNAALRAFLTAYPNRSKSDTRRTHRHLAQAFIGDAAPKEKEKDKKTATLSLNLEGANPFNPETTIAFSLPADAEVQLHIFNTAGQRVRTLATGGLLAAGRHRFVWRGVDDEGRPLGTGLYFARLQVGTQRAVRKLTLLK
jgi:parallel beta-helix repeat protein